MWGGWLLITGAVLSTPRASAAVRASIAAQVTGKVTARRPVAVVSALPTANKHPEQLRLTQEFLQAGKVSVDVFAVSEAGGGAAVSAAGADPLRPATLAGLVRHHRRHDAAPARHPPLGVS